MVLTAALVTMVALGVLFGACLALASRAFAVDGDERLDPVLEALPGANCGACGYGGCRAYAEAVIEGEKVSLCTVGGQDAAEALAAIMGVQPESVAPLRAVVHCQGGTSRCGQRSRYDGPSDCRAAHLTSGGPKACVHGCLGFGTCADACPFDAITMTAEGLPAIDAEKCTACGMCVKVCPRSLISLLDMRYKIYLGCSSRNSGKAVKEVCSVGCISCNQCAKKDPNGAVVMEQELPVLDFERSGGDFSAAAKVCPMDCFVVEEPVAVSADAEQPAGRESQ